MLARHALSCAVMVGLTLSCGGSPREAAEREPRANVLRVQATAYNSTPGQTQGDPRLTASGVRLQPGMRALAVSPDLAERGLAFGTEVRIEGVPGTWEVVDRVPNGPRRIDLYFGDDVEAARAFGRREVQIEWETP